MARSTAVLLVVGLTPSLLDRCPNLRRFAAANTVHRLIPVLPAVTCSVQASMLTGLVPSEHGIVGNGWYDRTSAEVCFWKQSNHLVGGEKVWETARRRAPSLTCAKLFWWYNMYSSADVSVTPRPIYKADGRKRPDVYTEPPGLRQDLQRELGTFPLFDFWGPRSSIASSRWIAEAQIRVHETYRPTLSLVYLPHLDYDLQRYGPEDPRIGNALAEIDGVVGRLLDYFEDRKVRVVVVSEYGIEPVDEAVSINRCLREHGLVRVRTEDGLELLDPGASPAFAVADHQVAHVYVRRPEDVDRVATLCADLPGVGASWVRSERANVGLHHPRAGDIVLAASPRRWFTYDYWLEDARAPDFARTVDIHRKPGYDPRELFLDPAITAPRLRVAAKLLRSRLGFRTLLDVIPLDTRIVRGSHGRVDPRSAHPPLLIRPAGPGPAEPEVPCTAVRDVILDQLFEP
jgi:predicted AlkP superfamily pyrophosphatase or phosphodiesterase